MVRRRWQLDPELAPLARERLRRVLGRDDVEDWEDDALPPVREPPDERGRAAPPRRAQVLPVEAVPQLDDLAPPRRFTRWHLGVVAGLVVLGLLWGGWSLLRARPVALAAPTVTPAAQVSAPAGPVAAPRASASAAPTLVVHVLGAVRKPGLVRLPDRGRVQDAIDAAGGLTRDADPGELNLAQPLTDGEQVVIGTRGHAAGEVRAGGGTAGTGSGSRPGPAAAASVDLNRATQAQLEDLPGVGPVTAQNILTWRQQHGRFTRTEELQEVDGIGPKTYAQIAPHVRV